VAVPVAANSPAPAPTAAPPASTAAAPVPPSGAQENAPTRVASASATAVPARMEAGRELLADPRQARYSVQLMVTDARERVYLEQYLGEATRALPPEQLYLVPAGNPENPRVGLLYGGFRDRGEANAALDTLPEGLRQFRPYVRSLEAVREEARRAQRR
jgi:MSHA biogenesis protein MshM